jgi:hypothetical protein
MFVPVLRRDVAQAKFTCQRTGKVSTRWRNRDFGNGKMMQMPSSSASLSFPIDLKQDER